MSEHDSGSGAGRRGFVRDMIGRIAPAGPRSENEFGIEAEPVEFGSDESEIRPGEDDVRDQDVRDPRREDRGPANEVEHLQVETRQRLPQPLQRTRQS